MKFLLNLILLFTSVLFGQTDKNGNPVFNSVTLSEEKFEDIQLSFNYYTLDNNVNNINSSVYISDKPSILDIEKSAINLPSDFVVLTKDSKILCIIMISTALPRQYLVLDPYTGSQKSFAFLLKGDISENRANEIIKQNFDTKAKIEKNLLYFNSKRFKIISNLAIKESIINLIKKEKLNLGKADGLTLLSNDELKKFIISESKQGGKFDFFTEIKGHEYDGVQGKPGVFATKIGIALYKWGRNTFELGLNTVDDALKTWSEIKGRDASRNEVDYITMGFNKELEK